MARGALIPHRAYTDRGFPAKYGQMSSHDSPVMTINLYDLLTTLMTMGPNNCAAYCNDHITFGRRLHFLDGDVGDVQGNLKDLVHGLALFSTFKAVKDRCK